MSLTVTNKCILDDDGVPIPPEAWRVAIVVDDEAYNYALNLAFGVQRDALRAKDALEKAGLEDLPTIRRAGKDAVIRIMIESLAW